MQSTPASSEQEIHDLFRGSAELSKHVRFLALVVECIAAGIALHAILADGSAILFRPLAVVLFAAIALALRGYAGNVDRFSEECRRTSVRAFATGSRIPANLCAFLRSDAPSRVGVLVKRLPAATLDEYYEPKAPPGESRLRELYAHSSFYTWRLLRAASRVYAASAAVIFMATFVIVYWLAGTDSPTVPRGRVLDALCSVVLVVFLLRAISSTFATCSAAEQARRASDALITSPLPSGESLVSLIDRYDFARMGVPGPPTMLYRIKRKELGAEWEQRRLALR